MRKSRSGGGSTDLPRSLHHHRRLAESGPLGVPGRSGGMGVRALWYHQFHPMDQAGRIIAGMKGAAAVTTPERIACGAWKRAVGKRLAAQHEGGETGARPAGGRSGRRHLARESVQAAFQILRNIEKEIGTEIVADLQFVVAPPRREAAARNRARSVRWPLAG